MHIKNHINVCIINMNQIFSTNMFHVKVCCLFGQWGKDLVDLGCRMCRQSAARAPPRLSDELKKELPGINLPVACQCGRSEVALSEELWVKYKKDNKGKERGTKELRIEFPNHMIYS